MTREGRDFKVVDAKTDEDITHNVLTQIIMEEESRGETMMPVNFLRQLISMYGDSMQTMVPGVSGGIDGQLPSQSRPVQDPRSKGAFANSPFADMAKRNLAMFDVAAQAIDAGNAAGAASPAPAARPVATKDDEIAALRSELAKLQDKVEKLGS